MIVGQYSTKLPMESDQLHVPVEGATLYVTVASVGVQSTVTKTRWRGGEGEAGWLLQNLRSLTPGRWGKS